MTTEEVDLEKDLPLLANVDDVRVRHYMFKFTPDFETKTFSTEVILLLEVLRETSEAMEMVLDARDIRVKSVQSINYPEEDTAEKTADSFELRKDEDNFEKWFSYPRSNDLTYQANPWSINIKTSKSIFPSAIYIHFETKEKGWINSLSRVSFSCYISY